MTESPAPVQERPGGYRRSSSGLIGAMIATGIAVGTATALLGTALIAFGLWQKARMEEGFLSTELGADAYGPYCQRVPMLVPFLPQR